MERPVMMRFGPQPRTNSAFHFRCCAELCHGMIRIGTSSWADPEFVRDWYPPKLPAAARLGWYAEHFDYVEVNSTFYAIPSRKVVERWNSETPARFLFDVKLHGFFSRHVVKPMSLPPDIRRFARSNPGGNLIVAPELERVVTERILEEIEPLSRAGKFGAFLLQLSPSFSPRKHELDELDHLASSLRDWRLAIELRNRNWLTDAHREATLQFFRSRQLALVLVDAPQSEHFTVMQTENQITNPKLAYLRLHGRNARAYISGRSVAERFNYDYSDQEIDEVADRVTQNSPKIRKTFTSPSTTIIRSMRRRQPSVSKAFWDSPQRERHQPGSRA